jgi:hypothetical protein
MIPSVSPAQNAGIRVQPVKRPGAAGTARAVAPGGES